MSYKLIINCLKCSIILSFLLLFQTSSAQFAELDKLVDQQQKNFNGNMVVMAWRGDSIFYQKATGEYTINSQEDIGEAGSWYTAALIMHYVDQGKISLDDPVAKYLPIFEKYAKSYLTIRHCLTHTTGLEGDKINITRLVKKNKFESLEEEVNGCASKREIISNPGIEFNYNQIGYNIAGRVLEIVGKKGFDRLMTEKIFRPAGMRKSTFTSEYSVNPFSGAKTTAADFIRFMDMLMKKGTINGKQILSEASVNELLSIQAENTKKVFTPAYATGYEPAGGSWVIEKNGSGKPSAFTNPALNGIWPWMDLCRNYAAIVFLKGPVKTDTKPLFEQVKGILDGANSKTCN